MDILETLKKQWQTKEQELPSLSYSDIYAMMLKKSSSVVKWILLISIAELLFWIVLLFILPDSNKQMMQDMGIAKIVTYSNYIHFAIVGVFIYMFYKNYKKIQVTDSTKSLMRNILRVRKTVRYFVYYNIGMFILSSVIMNAFFYSQSDKLYDVMGFASKGVPQEGFATFFISIQIVVGILVVGLLVLFYWLIYGLLLKRLKRNYKELERIEL